MQSEQFSCLRDSIFNDFETFVNYSDDEDLAWLAERMATGMRRTLQQKFTRFTWLWLYERDFYLPTI